ncbi:oxygenase MpaB family protein [Arsenicicoccus cauae]|uniref:oxygenase MpaB family protein n=1 Tax=Arsenicicoccus cauae TaxID=2663847 RepID=UPI00370D642E
MRLGRVQDHTARLRTRVALGLRERIAGTDADRRADQIWGAVGERWFGPDDAIWQVHADTSMFSGGLRALLLQSLHPLAMAGVADHSGYKGDPWGRLQRTSHYIAITTYGTVRHAEATIEAIRHLHGRVVGSTPDGLPYAANDPHLLRWVHVAEAESFLATYQAFGASRLTPAGLDEYVAQSAHVSSRLGVPLADLPQTYAELLQAVESYRGELVTTAAATEAARFLLLTPPIDPAARLGYWTLAVGAIATLPPWARRMLGLSVLPDPVTGVLDRVVGLPLGRASTATTRWVMSDPAVANESRSRAALAAGGQGDQRR